MMAWGGGGGGGGMDTLLGQYDMFSTNNSV